MAAEKDGFILVSVLLATTLLVTSATAFAWFARTEGQREARRELIKSCRNAAEVAVSVLGQKIAADKNKYDSRTEPLYAPGQHTEFDLGNYKISAKITPLNDRIALEGLFLPDGVTVRSEYEYAWNSIWEALEHPELAAQTVDFMDKDKKQKLGGTEREGNINRLVSDLSELRGIPELDDGILYGTKEKPGGLALYVTALGGQKLNINVAAPEVVARLDSQLTLSHANSIKAYSLLNPIKSLDDLKKVPGFPPTLATKLGNIIGFESELFRLEMQVTDSLGRTRNYRVTLKRNGKDCSVVKWEE